MMKYERIALWSIVVILVFVVLFQYRRSGFTIQPGLDSNAISVLDMMEYRYVPEEKRKLYKNMLVNNAASLSSLTDGGAYRMRVDQMLMNALTANIAPPPPGAPPPPPCSGVIIMGDCLATNICPTNMSMMTVGNKRYCVCPTGQKLVPSGPGKPPTCMPMCPTTMSKLITEAATGQQACASQCPPLPYPDGYSCK